MKKVLILLGMVGCLLLAASHVEGAITCGSVVSFLQPCFSYIQKGGTMPPACCNGVVGLHNAAKTIPDRWAACICFKQTLAAISGLQPALVSSLASKCGINLPYKLSPSMDCSTVT